MIFDYLLKNNIKKSVCQNFYLKYYFSGMDSKSAPINLSALTDTQLKLHSSWVQTWQNVIIDLDTYVRDFHPRGLKWKKGN